MGGELLENPLPSGQLYVTPKNLPNFTNPMASKIEAENGTFKFKGATSQPDRMEFVEATRKEIGPHEIDNRWYLVITREQNVENTII